MSVFLRWKCGGRGAIIYCENSLRGDDWLYKHWLSRLGPIASGLQQVRLLRLRGDFNALLSGCIPGSRGGPSWDPSPVPGIFVTVRVV